MTIRTLSLSSAVIGLVLSAAPAHADDATKVCTDAYEQAQSLRDASKLMESRAPLHLCAASTCKAFIVKDCMGWLLDAEARLPTVVLAAKDPSGRSLTDVIVSMDGVPIASKLDGAAIQINPGQHSFSFVAADGTKVEQSFPILEGQKAQPVMVVLGAPETASPAAPLDTSGSSGGQSKLWTTRREVGAGAAGVGVVGLIVGGIFGGLASSAASAQKSDCSSPTACTKYAQALSEHSTAQTDSSVSTAMFIVGGVLMAAGAVVFLTGGRHAEASSTALLLSPTVAPGGGGLVLAKGF